MLSEVLKHSAISILTFHLYPKGIISFLSSLVLHKQLHSSLCALNIVFSNTEMSLKEELVYIPEEDSSQSVLISRSSMVLKSD